MHSINRADLPSYEVSADRGFLNSYEPCFQLPEEYDYWEAIAATLGKLLVSGMLRKEVANLPLILPSQELSESEARRAMLLLSFLGHAYVWAPFEKPVHVIPQAIAMPWHAVATRLGRPPVLSYASYALDNWFCPDNKKQPELNNLVILQNFLGGMDEDWFILIHVDIEARAGTLIAAGVELCALAQADNLPGVSFWLSAIANTLKKMNETMAKMPLGCDPHIYYTRVRPYIHRFTHHPVFYEGVLEYDNVPQTFYGETGAKSSVVPLLDAILGIKHRNEDMLDIYLLNMRSYMPPKHRELIAYMESHSSLREYVKRIPVLHGIYNECISELTKFLRTHYEYAASYIHKQSQSSLSNPNDRGTGGTPFMEYLKKHLEDRERYYII